MIQLTQSQQKIVEECKQSPKGAVVQSVTGSGKTLIGLEILKQDYKTFLIVANTTHLVNQWKSILTQEGLLEDKNKIILLGTIQKFCKEEGMNFDILIVDEGHHLFAPIFIKLIENNTFKKIYILTATLARDDNRHKLKDKYGLKFINGIDYETGIKEKLLSKFEVEDVFVDLTEYEQQQLDKIQSFIDIHFHKSPFNNNFNLVNALANKGNFIANELRRCFLKRKYILNCAVNKIQKVVQVLSQNNFKQCLIYCEYIDQANDIYDVIKLHFTSTIYHSKIKDRDKNLEDFRNDKYKVLISVKALDEGFNLPQIDSAIIASSSLQERQTIQRIGRPLRYQEGKTAKIYNLVVENSKEESWLKKRMKSIN